MAAIFDPMKLKTAGLCYLAIEIMSLLAVLVLGPNFTGLL